MLLLRDLQYSISKLFFSFLFAHDNRIISEKQETLLIFGERRARISSKTGSSLCQLKTYVAPGEKRLPED